MIENVYKPHTDDVLFEGRLVNFYVRGEEYRYRCEPYFMEYLGCFNPTQTTTRVDDYLPNDRIFDVLGITNPDGFGGYMYGYDPEPWGVWPPCKDGDYKSLQKLVDTLHDLCVMTDADRKTEITKIQSEVRKLAILSEF